MYYINVSGENFSLVSFFSLELCDSDEGQVDNYLMQNIEIVIFFTFSVKISVIWKVYQMKIFYGNVCMAAEVLMILLFDFATELSL